MSNSVKRRGGSHDNNPPKVIDSRDMALIVTCDKNGVGEAQAMPGLPRRQAAEYLRTMADQFDRRADELGEPPAPEGGFLADQKRGPGTAS